MTFTRGQLHDVLAKGYMHTFIELQELVGTAGSPSLFLRQPVVGVALVFGRFTHISEISQL